MAILPLRVVLGRIADELVWLRDEGMHAQDATGLLVGAASTGTPLPDAALVGLQALDGLAQHLAALSALLGAMAAGLPEEVRIDPDTIIPDWPLALLRARLLGEAAPEPSGTEIELF